MPNAKLNFPLITVLIIAVVIISSLLPRFFSGIVGPIQFKEKFGIDQVSQVLTILFLIALFFERALEVYILTFRKLNEEILEKKLEPLGSAMADTSQNDLARYKDETRKIALWAALCGGILISMIGVRGLEPFLEMSVDVNGIIHIKNVTQWQEIAFRIFDILLTGAMIAGGSDTLHKILNVFTTFMDTATEASKTQANTLKAQATQAMAATSQTTTKP
jgi:hypothetical protein